MIIFGIRQILFVKLMEKCKVIINKMSGRAKNLTEADIKDMLSEFSVEFCYIENPEDSINNDDCDNTAVCGGDGTLNHALNLKGNTIYIPCGTLNETAKCATELKAVGNLSGHRFAYVAAAGSFTEIGYKVKTKNKQHFKIFAYFGAVLKAYKVHRLVTNITADKTSYSGTYSLIMFLRSPRCFGFNFNRSYNPDDNKLNMLLIKTPERPFAFIKLFFPFFRVFFVGLNKDLETKNITFKTVSEASVTLSAPVPFCVDGECYIPETSLDVNVEKLEHPIKIFPFASKRK